MGRCTYRGFPVVTGAPTPLSQRISHGVSQADTVTSVSGLSTGGASSSHTGRSDSARSSVIITSQTSVPEAFRHLIAYGCPDITSDLSPWETTGGDLIPYAGGRFGDVYKWASKHGHPIGIKCLRLHALSESNAKRVKRAIRELYFWSKAKHRNVLELSGVTIFKGQLAMVSPWMDKGHLQQYVRLHPHIDRWALCLQVAEGLAYLHGIGLVHGDLKAMNVLVSNNGVLKISDFGNSLMEECSLGFTATVTIGGGSLRWMAYELVDETNVDRSTMTDVYSLAMTILEVLSAQVPFHEYPKDAQVMKALLLRRLPAQPEQLSEQAKWGNERWELLINCWDVVPTLRPTSAEVLSRLCAVVLDDIMATLQKHIVSSPSSLVVDALLGVAGANPSATVDEQHKVLYLSRPDRSRVALISGGGAGHEPAHSGFVGEGMLTAAVCGDVFASPNANQVKRALNLVENEKGTLMVVKSYTGDILNFGLAREQYCAANPSRADALKFVIVGDDVSVGKTQGEIVGRRGLTGTVLVYKIAGALAQQGASLDEVHEVAQFVADRLGTIAVGLEHCHVPGTEPAGSHLKDDEIEVGMGIHNEPGHSRISPIPPISDLVDRLLKYLLATPATDADRAFLPWPEQGAPRSCVLLVNNLGGLSALELGSIAKVVSAKLGEVGVSIERMLVGTYMTSLNMPGFSVTLLLLPQNNDGAVPKEKILQLLDAPAKTPAWTWTSTSPPRANNQAARHSDSERNEAGTRDNAPTSSQFIESVRRACAALIQAEPDITRMDQIVGDGDCGTTLKVGAEAILDNLNKPDFASYGAAGAIGQIGRVVGDAMGGTSGALYSIYLSALAQGLQSAVSGGSDSPNREEYASAAAFALERLYTYTRARPPSRTLVDPLAAFVEALKDPGSSLDQALEAAHRAAENTKSLPARAGRAAYVNAETVKGTCDPGAWGVWCLLQGLLGRPSK